MGPSFGCIPTPCSRFIMAERPLLNLLEDALCRSLHGYELHAVAVLLQLHAVIIIAQQSLVSVL